MRMSERHHVYMEVMFKSCSFKPTRVHGSNISVKVLKMFRVTSRDNFHNRHHTDTKWMIYEHHSQSSVLPQTIGILRIFFTTGDVCQDLPIPSTTFGQPRSKLGRR